MAKRQRITDIVKETMFHEEIKTETLTRNDILDEEIVVYDVSEVIKHTKGGKFKFDSDNVLILMSHEEDEKNSLHRCWISGSVLIKQLLDLQKAGIPDDGVLMCCTYNDKYYKWE